MARSLRSLAMAAVALLSLANLAFAQEGIAWTNNLRDAQTAAARDGKLVLLHFYSDNCPPCRALERNVFPLPEVAVTIHRNYVPVKVHVDSLPQLADRFRVESWPTDVILTAAGLEVYRTTSPRSAADYQSLLDHVAFQAGVGAGRIPGNNHLNVQSAGDRRADVSLAAATEPMGPLADASSGPAPGSTAPARTSPFDQGPAPSAAPSASAANPYAPRQAPHNRLAQQTAGQQRQAAAPPRAAAPPPAAAASTLPPTTPPQRSIYDPIDQPAAAPPASAAPPAHAPPQRQLAAPGRSQQPAPVNSIYEPSPQQQMPQQSAHQQRPAYQPPAGPAATSTPAQRASAQFREPRTILRDQAPPFAIEGFCPVTILETNKWWKGDVRFGAVHHGRTYLFASEEAQRRFLADPDRYAPVLSGCDPVVFAETTQLIDGNHNIGLLMGGKTYFFTSEETLTRFKLSPQVYIGRAYQAMAAGHLRTR